MRRWSNSMLTVDAAWAENLKAVRASLAWMPDGPYRRYCTWVIDEPRLSQRWLQTAGVVQLVRMSGELLAGLITDDEAAALLPASALMNVGQMYEVITDDLAMGLAARVPGDSSVAARRTLVRTFNEAMLARLAGAPAAGVRDQLLALEDHTAEVSLFAQSMGEDERRTLVAAYHREHPDDAVAIERSIIPSLIANVEANVALEDRLRGCHTQPVFREGLARRYRAVNELLARRPATTARRLALGADAIMVVPTLAYYAGLLAEEIRPLRGYDTVLADGTLGAAMDHAALLVRVLNDCGTTLIEQSDAEHYALLAHLHTIAHDDSPTLTDVLLRAAREADDQRLTRLHKDLVFGEFNVGLDGLREQHATPAVVDAFGARLAEIKKAYRARTAALDAAAEGLQQHLGTGLIGDLFVRFVAFHREVYAHGFDSPLGDYAVPASAVAC